MANETRPNDSIHPIRYTHEFNHAHDVHTDGLTKREYFAAMAMQGLLANGSTLFTKMEPETVALHSTELADALIHALTPKEN